MCQVALITKLLALLVPSVPQLLVLRAHHVQKVITHLSLASLLRASLAQA